MISDVFQVEVEEVKLLRDKIAGKIRDAIVEGKIKPGEQIGRAHV